MDNYPPGVTDKDFENPYNDLAESVRANADIKISISVEVNGDVVYEDYSGDMEDFEGSCLRKAENAIESTLTKLTDSKWEDRNEPGEEI